MSCFPAKAQYAIIGDAMKLGRSAIPIIAVLAIVAVGAATSAVVVAARSQQPQTLTPLTAAGVRQPLEPPPAVPVQANPQDKPTPAHVPTTKGDATGGDASSKPALQSTGQAWPKSPTGGTGPKPTPKPIVNRGPKGNRAPPGPPILRGEAESSQAALRAGDAGGKGLCTGNSLHLAGRRPYHARRAPGGPGGAG